MKEKESKREDDNCWIKNLKGFLLSGIFTSLSSETQLELWRSEQLGQGHPGARESLPVCLDLGCPGTSSTAAGETRINQE